MLLLGVTRPVLEMRIPMNFVGDPDALRYVVTIYSTVIAPDGSITKRNETSWVEAGTVVTPLGVAPDELMDLESFCDIGCPNGVAP